ncbi:Dynein associated protein domain-containing protein [Plasmodiophora brassicae]
MDRDGSPADVGDDLPARITRDRLIAKSPALFARAATLADRRASFSGATFADHGAVTSLNEKLQTALRHVTASQTEVESMRFRIDALTQELKRVEREKAALRNDLEDSQQALECALLDVEILKEQRDSIRLEVTASLPPSERQTAALLQRITDLSSAVKSLRQVVLSQQHQAGLLQADLSAERDRAAIQVARIASLENAVAQRDARIDELASADAHQHAERALQSAFSQLEAVKESNSFLEALTEAQSEIELGHMELETELQSELDEKDREISALYRTLRLLQQHAHRLFSDGQRSQGLVELLQKDNMELSNMLQRLQHSHSELHEKSRLQLSRNLDLTRLLNRARQSQIALQLRELQCVQSQYQLSLLKAYLPDAVMTPADLAAITLVQVVHRILFKSNAAIMFLEESLSGLDTGAPEFRTACHCAQICTWARCAASELLVALSGTTSEQYLAVGVFHGELFPAEVALDDLVRILGNDELTYAYSTTDLQQSTDAISAFLQSRLGWDSFQRRSDEDLPSHFIVATLSGIYFDQLEQTATWNDIRCRLTDGAPSDPSSELGQSWRYTVEAELDNLLAMHHRIRSVCHGLAHSNHMLAKADLDRAKAVSDDACSVTKRFLNEVVTANRSTEVLHVLLVDRREPIMQALSNARSTLSALVNNNLTVKEPDDERQDLLQLRFDGERFPWSTRAVDIRTHFEGLENYARQFHEAATTISVMSSTILDKEQRLQQATTMCATLSEKVNDLRQREQVSRNKIQHLEERLRLLQDGQPFEDAGLTVSVRPLGTLSSALNGDAPFYEESSQYVEDSLRRALHVTNERLRMQRLRSCSIVSKARQLRPLLLDPPSSPLQGLKSAVDALAGRALHVACRPVMYSVTSSTAQQLQLIGDHDRQLRATRSESNRLMLQVRAAIGSAKWQAVALKI